MAWRAHAAATLLVVFGAPAVHAAPEDSDHDIAPSTTLPTAKSHSTSIPSVGDGPTTVAKQEGSGSGSGSGAISNSPPTAKATPVTVTTPAPTKADRIVDADEKVWCRGGVESPGGDFCCPYECGQCGGSGCSRRQGGASACCTSYMQSLCIAPEDSKCSIPSSTTTSKPPTTTSKPEHSQGNQSLQKTTLRPPTSLPDAEVDDGSGSVACIQSRCCGGDAGCAELAAVMFGFSETLSDESNDPNENPGAAIDVTPPPSSASPSSPVPQFPVLSFFAHSPRPSPCTGRRPHALCYSVALCQAQRWGGRPSWGPAGGTRANEPYFITHIVQFPGPASGCLFGGPQFRKGRRRRRRSPEYHMPVVCGGQCIF